MTMHGVMLEWHGRSLPVVNGISAYPIKLSPAIRADLCNNVSGKSGCAGRAAGTKKCDRSVCNLARNKKTLPPQIIFPAHSCH